jgi:hypothetical protein
MTASFTRFLPKNWGKSGQNAADAAEKTPVGAFRHPLWRTPHPIIPRLATSHRPGSKTSNPSKTPFKWAFSAFWALGFRAVVFLLLCFTLATQPVRAQIEVQDTRMELAEDGHYLVAQFLLELPPRLQDAVSKGVTLYFVTETEIIRPRWYWLNEKSAVASQSLRLSYNTVTRQYRVGFGNGPQRGGIDQGFATLGEALGRMSGARLKVAERGVLKSGEEYQVWVRMRLDTTQLPKPFQVSAITNKEWALAADWKKSAYSFTAPVSSAVAVPTPPSTVPPQSAPDAADKK